jgi:hypothetical protein
VALRCYLGQLVDNSRRSSWRKSRRWWRSRWKIGATFFLPQGEASSSDEDSSFFRPRIAAPTSHGPSPVHSYLLYYLPNLDILYLRTVKHGSARTGTFRGGPAPATQYLKAERPGTFRARSGLLRVKSRSLYEYYRMSPQPLLA